MSKWTWFKRGDRLYVRRWGVPMLAKIVDEGEVTCAEREPASAATFVFWKGGRWTKHPQVLTRGDFVALNSDTADLP